MIAALIFAVRALRATEWKRGSERCAPGRGAARRFGGHAPGPHAGRRGVRRGLLRRAPRPGSEAPSADEAGGRDGGRGGGGRCVRPAGAQGRRRVSGSRRRVLVPAAGRCSCTSRPGWDPHPVLRDRAARPARGSNGQRISAWGVFGQYAARITGRLKIGARTEIPLVIGVAVSLAFLLLWGSRDLEGDGARRHMVVARSSGGGHGVRRAIPRVHLQSVRQQAAVRLRAHSHRPARAGCGRGRGGAHRRHASVDRWSTAVGHARRGSGPAGRGPRLPAPQGPPPARDEAPHGRACSPGLDRAQRSVRRAGSCRTGGAWPRSSS